MATSSALPPDFAATLQALNNDVAGHKVPSRPKQTLCSNARLRIHFEDVADSTTQAFMKHINLSTLLESAIRDVQDHLFTPRQHSQPPTTTLVALPPTNLTSSTSSSSTSARATASSSTSSSFRPHPPVTTYPPQEVRSITLVLESMDGVAYTTGKSIDEAHKEIHLSISYCRHLLDSNKNNIQAFVHEILGVMTHEMVHCFQHSCHGSTPGGLIEGLADYVRLKSGLAPPHWKKFPADKDSRGEKWDEGYQKTAWFLEWVEQETESEGEGMCRLNREMKTGKWDDGKCWKKCFGEDVEEMWKRYRSGWEHENERYER